MQKNPEFTQKQLVAGIAKLKKERHSLIPSGDNYKRVSEAIRKYEKMLYASVKEK